MCVKRCFRKLDYLAQGMCLKTGANSIECLQNIVTENEALLTQMSSNGTVTNIPVHNTQIVLAKTRIFVAKKILLDTPLHLSEYYIDCQNDTAGTVSLAWLKLELSKTFHNHWHLFTYQSGERSTNKYGTMIL